MPNEVSGSCCAYLEKPRCLQVVFPYSALQSSEQTVLQDPKVNTCSTALLPLSLTLRFRTRKASVRCGDEHQAHYSAKAPLCCLCFLDRWVFCLFHHLDSLTEFFCALFFFPILLEKGTKVLWLEKKKSLLMGMPAEIQVMEAAWLSSEL